VKTITKDEILCSSSAWISVLLNFIPGLGTGYIYQRRWKAYWLTNLFTIIWISLINYRNLNIDLSDPANSINDDLYILGIITIGLFTAIESLISLKNSRAKLDSIKE
tara:strand:+ start:477 stop:797 length:321 start_codon:yes stop_codon:yes gene_type:complete